MINKKLLKNFNKSNKIKDVIAQLRNKEQELLDQHRRQLDDLRDELE